MTATMKRKRKAGKATHTPGPWSTGHGSHNTIAVLAREEWDAPVVANVSAKDRSVEEVIANAALIAAAPALLGALKSVQTYLAAYGDPKSGQNKECLSIIARAIAKAEEVLP